MSQTINVPRELLERVIGEGAGTSLNAMRELRAILAAPRQPEGEEIAWSLRSDVAGCGLVRYMTDRKYQAQTQAIKQWYEPFRCQQCADAKRAITELRDMLSGEVETNIQLRQQAFDLTEQRDKLAEALVATSKASSAAEVDLIVDSALAEVSK